MKFFCLLGFVGLCMPLAANGAETIKPGMGIDAVKRTLHRHGYKVGDEYTLAIEAETDVALEFCRIDDDITLVLHYDRRTQKVRSLGLYLFPQNGSSKDAFTRDALEMQFEDNGVYTVKLRRKVDSEETNG